MSECQEEEKPDGVRRSEREQIRKGCLSSQEGHPRVVEEERRRVECGKAQGESEERDAGDGQVKDSLLARGRSRLRRQRRDARPGLVAPHSRSIERRIALSYLSRQSGARWCL
jgi:hypothetical protein